MICDAMRCAVSWAELPAGFIQYLIFFFFYLAVVTSGVVWHITVNLHIDSIFNGIIVQFSVVSSFLFHFVHCFQKRKKKKTKSELYWWIKWLQWRLLSLFFCSFSGKTENKMKKWTIKREREKNIKRSST